MKDDTSFHRKSNRFSLNLFHELRDNKIVSDSVGKAIWYPKPPHPRMSEKATVRDIIESYPWYQWFVSENFLN